MFYFKEITYRLYFTFCLVIITACIINSYRYLLILIVFLPLTSSKAAINIVYPDPFVIMKVYFELTLAFTFVFVIPYILIEILDFLKPGLNRKTLKKHKYLGSGVLLGVVLFNAISLNYVMPEI